MKTDLNEAMLIMIEHINKSVRTMNSGNFHDAATMLSFIDQFVPIIGRTMIYRAIMEKAVGNYETSQKFTSMGIALDDRNEIEAVTHGLDITPRRAEIATMERSFAIAYEHGLWSKGETKSGIGSTINYTKHIREYLPHLLQIIECKTLLDAPCGDCNWINQTNLGDCRYIGADVVEQIVADLRTSHPGSDFRKLDITRDQLPKADLWLCRDLLFHLSLTDVEMIIANLLKSDITYFATTHFLQCTVNMDGPSGPRTGLARNLCLPPFSFPQPLYCLWDSVPEHTPRWLAVWKTSDIVRHYHSMNRTHPG